MDIDGRTTQLTNGGLALPSLLNMGIEADPTNRRKTINCTPKPNRSLFRLLMLRSTIPPSYRVSEFCWMSLLNSTNTQKVIEGSPRIQLMGFFFITVFMFALTFAFPRFTRVSGQVFHSKKASQLASIQLLPIPLDSFHSVEFQPKE